MTDEKFAATIDIFVRDLEQAFDPGRLAPYYPADGNQLAMVTTYFWNVALCKELYLSLGTVEVTMRNAIHNTLTAHFDTPGWYDVSGLLQEREAQAIARSKKEIHDAGKPATPGRVVAAMTFGFWTGLLSALYGESPYGPSLWTPNDAELTRIAFPHLHPSNQNRGYVHRRFNTIRALRNRVVHHEPIWRGVRMQNRRIVPLKSLYHDALEAIGWISPSVRDSIVALDRFPDALYRGQSAIESDIKRHLAMR